MKILICNVGSTSLKYKLFDFPSERVIVEARIERIGDPGKAGFSYIDHPANWKTTESNIDVPDYKQGIMLFLGYLTGKQGTPCSLEEIDAIGFKTVLAIGYFAVHELTGEVLKEMDSRLDIAPLHNACYLEAIRTFKEILPDKKMVGAFETNFHRTIPVHARIYGAPYNWYAKDGIQRLGIHGASHGYIAGRMREITGKDTKIISCHLGGSSSICAIKDGKSIAVSSGLSPQTGLPHSDRVGDLDVYALIYELSLGKTMEEIRRELFNDSGLYGLSGVSTDMRDIEEAASAGNERARLTIDFLCYEILRYIGSFYIALEGADNLVFTAGIGEKSVIIREQVCKKLEFLGVRIDDEINRTGSGERKISSADSKLTVWVVPTNEEIQVGRQIFAYLDEH
jgi:acetate kinase